MVSKLFNNDVEEKAFFNLIATRKYKKINNQKKTFDDDIEEYIKRCDEILSENNARCNYVAEILAHKDITSQSQINTGYNDNTRLSEIDELTKEFLEFLNTVPLNVKEDIEFYSKRIDDRLERTSETSLAQQSILEYYPIADKLNVNETLEELSVIFDNITSFDTSIVKENNIQLSDLNNRDLPEYIEPTTSILEDSFNNDINEIKPIMGENTLFIEKEIKLDENLLVEKEETSKKNKVSKRYEVIGIKKVPTKGITLDIEKDEQEIKLLDSESIINLEDLKPQLNLEEINDDIKPEISFEEINEDIKPEISFEEINEDIKPEISFEEINQTETDNTIITETNFKLSDLEDVTENLPKEKIELNETPEKPLDSLDTDADNKDETVSFKMPKGFSIIDIALAICGDSNGWLDIYDMNKEIFNNIVKEKNNNNFDNIENDLNIFSGLNIKIPTVFKKDIPKSSLKVA